MCPLMTEIEIASSWREHSPHLVILEQHSCNQVQYCMQHSTPTSTDITHCKVKYIYLGYTQKG